MGACCGGDSTTRHIDNRMANHHKMEETSKKILLLGSGASGKSTLFKQVRDINPGDEVMPGGTNKEKESAKEEAKNVIRMNLIAEMATIITRAIVYNNDDPEKYADLKPDFEREAELEDPTAPEGRYIISIKEAAETVVTLSRDAFNDLSDPTAALDAIEQNHNNENPDEYWTVLGVYLQVLWDQDWIQNTFQRRKGLFSLSDNIDYFFSKARECMNPNYVVSDEDYLKVRIRTTGVIQHKFPYVGTEEGKPRRQFTITMIDVGGQRNERKKWIHSFDTIAALLFVSALNHYCEVLFEEETKNAMWESLDLFHETLEGKWFRHTSVMLFLNKEDLYRECVACGERIGDCFDGNDQTHPNGYWPGAYDQETAIYKGPEFDPAVEFEPQNGMDSETVKQHYFRECCDAGIEFIEQQFQGVAVAHYKQPQQSFYCHVTTATDRNNIKKVFDVVIHNAVMNQLQIAGVL